MSEVNVKDALREQARVQRKLAEGVKSMGETLALMASGLIASSDALVLLAGETGVTLEVVASTAASVPTEPPKQTRQRKAPEAKTETNAPPAPPAVTIDDLKVLAQKVADAKNRDMVVAVLQRNGIQRFGDAKPDMYPKLKAELEAVLTGNDPTASNAADEGW